MVNDGWEKSTFNRVCSGCGMSGKGWLYDCIDKHPVFRGNDDINDSKCPDCLNKEYGVITKKSFNQNPTESEEV